MKRSGLFFTELVLDLLIFALCAVVSLSLVIRADGISKESKNLSEAINIAQSVADLWRTTGEVSEEFIKTTHLTIDAVSEGNLLDITIYEDETIVFELEGVAHYGK